MAGYFLPAMLSFVLCGGSFFTELLSGSPLFFLTGGDFIAATRLIPMHINKGKSTAKCLQERIDYAINPEKTESGRYVTAYECDPHTAAEEFLLSKRQYEHTCGRTQKHDVIAYQIRQSFKPGEITAEEANAIGRELALRFTKGKHAFIVATHTDRAHIHNHIIFNSTSLDCKQKFKNFYLSSFTIARISDLLCMEHNLSVITPKPYRERVKYTAYPARTSIRDEIRADIDAVLAQRPKDWDAFITLLKGQGYEFKNGKQPSVHKQGQKRFVRFNSLGEGYTVDDITAAISDKSRTKPNATKSRQPKWELNFLIDIQAKIAAGKGVGYQRWAKVFNLKQMSKTLIFLQEHGINSIDELNVKADAASARFDGLQGDIKADEKRLAEIAVLRKHIINYAKTRDTYVAYRKAGYSKAFFEAHRQELTLHKAAKEAFDELSVKQIPRVKDLNAEYAEVLARKKATYVEYRKAKVEMQDWLIAQKAVQAILQDEVRQEEQIKKQTEQNR